MGKKKGIVVDELPKTDKARSRKRRKTESKSGEGQSSQQAERGQVIPLVASYSSARLIGISTPVVIWSNHKKKLRNLCVSPAADRKIATSSLDGRFKFWQLQGTGGAIVPTHTFQLPGEKVWSEDFTWHPSGERVFAVFDSHNEDGQVAIVGASPEDNLKFLTARPHVKGLLQCIEFMPWSDTCFVTAGDDHAVVLWTEKNDTWNATVLHDKSHTSSVLGVTGTTQRKWVLSAGVDRRFHAYDLESHKFIYEWKLPDRLLGVYLNPVDPNLLLLQGRSVSPVNSLEDYFLTNEATCHGSDLKKQLRLFDLREANHYKPLHQFGWDGKNTVSGLVYQCWSPDGMYVSTGTSVAKFHIFDIRYNGRVPTHTIATGGLAIKACWHPTEDLLMSISTDRSICIYKIA